MPLLIHSDDHDSQTLRERIRAAAQVAGDAGLVALIDSAQEVPAEPDPMAAALERVDLIDAPKKKRGAK